MPRELTEAQVAGIQMFAHDRLRRGAERELAASSDQLLTWALSYETPAARLRASPGEEVAVPSATAPEPVERILRAVAELCAEAGVTRLTAQAIAARAHVSLGTLYKHSRGAEAAFLACFIAARDRALAAALVAYRREEEWPAALRAALGAILAYLAAEPAFARVAMVEVLAAGPKALAARDLALAPFTGLLTPGLALAPEAPPIAAELGTFAVYALVGRHIARHGSSRLPSLLPTATFLALAPFLGAAAAASVANGDLSAPAAVASVRT